MMKIRPRRPKLPPATPQARAMPKSRKSQRPCPINNLHHQCHHRHHRHHRPCRRRRRWSKTVFRQSQTIHRAKEKWKSRDLHVTTEKETERHQAGRSPTRTSPRLNRRRPGSERIQKTSQHRPRTREDHGAIQTADRISQSLRTRASIGSTDAHATRRHSRRYPRWRTGRARC
jgi:hypothetical protein